MEVKKLTPAETSNLWNSYLTNTMTLGVSKYFIAKTQDEELHTIYELKKHFQRGVEMLQKHLDIFQSILTENDLPKLPTWESELTDTTASPFSDRLMLYKMTLLAAETSSRYGTALCTVQRKDLATHFMRLMSETLQYGEDSVNLMIERGFIDQLPIAKERSTVPSSM
jgi:hypothetical protein